MPSQALIDAFWSRVVKPSDPTACWLLRRRTGHEGGLSDASRYEVVTAGRERALAHRLSWEIANGPIQSGLLMRHKCDNKRCVNPLHLTPGTAQENVADAVERNRLNPSRMFAPDGYMSVADASAVLGIGCRRLQELCKQGRVLGAQLLLGRSWVVPLEVRLTAGTRGPKLRASDNVVENNS